MALRGVGITRARSVRALSLFAATLLVLRNQFQTPTVSLAAILNSIQLASESQTGVTIPAYTTVNASHNSSNSHNGTNSTHTNSATTSVYTPIEQQEALKYAKHIESLRTSTLKYYVYDDPQITREGADFPENRVDEEIYVFHPFLHTNNSWRVTDPDLADLFIVPAPIYSHGHWMGAMRRMMQALTRHPIFRKTQGGRHVIFALDGRYFDIGNSTLSPRTMRFNEKWGTRLVNATIVMNYDTITCKNLHEDNHDYGDWNDYFANVKPIAKHTFSIGLVAGSFLPVVPASYERFQTMDYTLFYHTRIEPFDNGSTQYRWAPINITLPYKATIGYALPPEQWIQRFTSSKFCLIVRGDTPNSHALLRAVKVGCIPVVVCDDYPVFSPTFKTSLDMRDFSIFLDEKAFLENPQQQLASLKEISEVVIRKKLVALQYAQQITCPDHPDSLFIPALLREADASFLPTYEH